MHDELIELKARHERQRLLYEVGNLIHSTLEPQEALQIIVEQAAQLTRASSGSAILINPTSGLLEIHAATGLPANAAEMKLRLGEGITGWVARTGKPARINDVSRDRRYVMLHGAVRSELAVPLEVNGEVRGVLNVDSERLEAFSADDQALLETLAVQAARAIHHTWLYEQLRLKARLFESLANVSRTINSTLNLDDALNAITREACVLMQAKMCSLMLLDDSGEWLDLRAHYGAGEAYVRKPRLNAEDSVLGIVVRRKKPLQIENVQTSARYQNVELARQEGLVTLLGIPLIYSGRAIGVLSVYTGKPFHFSNEEIRILAALAELSAIAIEKARLYERVVDVEEQLRQNEKLSALGLLAAEVAHEIRNPLTVMKMLYHSLNLRFPEGDPRAKDSHIIAGKMEHLNKIVEQILDFARTAEPEFAPVDLSKLIDELGLLVRHKLKNQNVQLVRNLHGNLPAVMGEAMQLEQAFLNLILNAAEAMPEGGTLTISVRVQSRTRVAHLPENAKHPHSSKLGGAVGARSQPTHVVIEFSDTGQGLTLQQRRQLFSSMLSSSKPKGTGLGLAIVRRVVEAHQGELEIKSKPNKGTTVSMFIPIRAPSAPADP